MAVATTLATLLCDACSSSSSDAPAGDAGADVASADAGTLDTGTSAKDSAAGTDSSIVDTGVDVNQSSADTGVDVGVEFDAQADASDDAIVDAGPPVINECTDADFAANDMRVSGSRTISFPTGTSPLQYTPHCLRISVGQSVTWSGAFANHPLMSFNGDVPTPITFIDTGLSTTFAFPNAGTYGYGCQFHTSIMFGAVQVLP